MGVVTVNNIDYGQIFGPFSSHLTATDPAYVIGMLTNDKQPEGIIVRVNIAYIELLVWNCFLLEYSALQK